MRVVVLCNDRLGLPALQQLVQNRVVQAAATSDRSPEMVAIMQQVSAQGGVPTQVFTKENFEASLLAWLNQHKPDVVLVKTFPFRIPASALTVPKYGFINFHYAPLPAFRGSNPLFWMIKEGVTTGGVAIHRMDEKFDRGPVLMQQEVRFSPDSTFGMCVSQLAMAGAQLTFPLLQALHADKLESTPQTTEKQRWYGRPKPEDFQVAWLRMDASSIKALAKACNPWMKGAHVNYKGWIFTLTDVTVLDKAIPSETLPGTILELSPTLGLIIACLNATVIRADVIYTEEGYFPGQALLQFGLKPGDRLM